MWRRRTTWPSDGQSLILDQPWAAVWSSNTFKDAVLPDGKPNPKPQVVDEPGVWEYMTYADMKAKARALGTCLRKVYGIGQREKIAIRAGNSTDWIIADQTCAAFNFTSVSVYDTLGPDAASFIIADSGAQVVVVEAKTLQRLPDALEDEVYAKNPGGDVKVVVYFGKGDLEAKATLEKKGIAVISIDDAIREHLAALVPDTPPTPKDVVTLMYTSGTTGNPKGVMILHSNVVASIGM